jgi:hypothetical protein
MNRSGNYKKLDLKSKKKPFNSFIQDEENISFKEVKEERQKKHFRNYDNALRSKNIDRLLSYEDD